MLDFLKRHGPCSAMKCMLLVFAVAFATHPAPRLFTPGVLPGYAVDSANGARPEWLQGNFELPRKATRGLMHEF